MNTKNKNAIIITILLLCSSCVKTLTIQEIGKKPTNQEAISFVKQYIEENYYDSNVKNVRVKEAVYGKILVGNYFPIPQMGWVICYQSNGKNLYGAYTGITKESLGVQNMELKPDGGTSLGWRFCKNAKWINDIN